MYSDHGVRGLAGSSPSAAFKILGRLPFASLKGANGSKGYSSIGFSNLFRREFLKKVRSVTDARPNGSRPAQPNFYSTHGPVTDPGRNSWMLSGTNASVEATCKIVQRILFHPFMGRKHRRLTHNRLKELEIRSMEDMLAKLGELASLPVSEERRESQRLLANCRGFATLLCAILRQNGAPARVRYGFAAYFAKDFYADHVICEYWKPSTRKWAIADAQLDEDQRETYNIDFGASDVPREKFLVAGEAWRLYRDGLIAPNRVGLDPSLRARGTAFLSSAIVRDLAALNKFEMLCTDTWGLSERSRISSTDKATLDRVANLTVKRPAGSEVFDIFRNDPCFAIPSDLEL
jgi:transglutaminase superfamily protein